MKENLINMLRAAEVQFRLASAVRLAVTLKNQPLDLPRTWIHGWHKVNYEELALTEKGATLGAQLLQYSSTYIMAVQIKEALKCYTDNKAMEDRDPNVRNAFVIAVLIRNAFAHNPLQPQWKIDRKYKNTKFSLDGIIELDTSGLDGKRLDWRHYGGPLAMLRFSEFVRTKILGDDGEFGSNRTNVIKPKNEYFQQSNLVLVRLISKTPQSH